MIHDIQRKLLSYARENSLDGKTLRELGEAVGETHPQKVKHHLEQLIAKGHLQRDETGSITVVETDYSNNNPALYNSLISIPIRGAANCGPAQAIVSDEVEGYLRISPRLVSQGHRVFALRAIGSSMNRAAIKGSPINEGDYVLVDQDEQVKDGDYVLSIIDGLANIKRLGIDLQQQQFVLFSESSTQRAPIVIDPEDRDYYINGKVIRVIKAPTEPSQA